MKKRNNIISFRFKDNETADMVAQILGEIKEKLEKSYNTPGKEEDALALVLAWTLEDMQETKA